MAKNRTAPEEYSRPLRRLLVWIAVLLLVGIFILWRIDSPRVERFRAALIDARLQFGPKLHEQPVRRLHPDGALGRRRLELVDAAGVRLLFRTPALLRLLGLGLARRQHA